MKQDKAVLTLALLLAPFFLPGIAAAQSAKPTADQDIQLSVFGAASGDYTGLSGGRNLSVTAGIDLALAPWHGMRPTLEIRGIYPIDKGKIVSQKDVLGGLRLDFLLGHRMHPYGDFLFGRGQTNYTETPCNATGRARIPSSGIQQLAYQVSTSYVYSPGAGFDYDLSNHLVNQGRWPSPAMGHRGGANRLGKALFHPQIIGLVYRFGKLGMP